MTSGKPQPAALDRRTIVPGISDSRFGLRWPLASCLELGPLPSAVPCARLYTKVILQEWDLASVTDEAELIVSELATNALQASLSLTETQPIVLHLLANDERLIIQVWDALPTSPAPWPHALDAEAGRGLEIVSLLSDRWGFYRPRGGGKIVWAALDVRRPGEGTR
jgi:anti-sigma regulatory factor (Ser/Thr protein kinase)